MAAERTLVLVSVDPERSHRANEAIRIALGILAGENAVTLALLGPATKLLDAEVEDYADGEDARKHLATLKKLGQAFHVDAQVYADHSPADKGWNPEGVAVLPLAPADLARLVAESDRVLAF